MCSEVPVPGSQECVRYSSFSLLKNRSTVMLMLRVFAGNWLPIHSVRLGGRVSWCFMVCCWFVQPYLSNTCRLSSLLQSCVSTLPPDSPRHVSTHTFKMRQYPKFTWSADARNACRSRACVYHCLDLNQPNIGTSSHEQCMLAFWPKKLVVWGHKAWQRFCGDIWKTTCGDKDLTGRI